MTFKQKTKKFFMNLIGMDTSRIGVLKDGEYLKHLKGQTKNSVCRLLVKRTIQYERLKNEITRLGLRSKIDKKLLL